MLKPEDCIECTRQFKTSKLKSIQCKRHSDPNHSMALNNPMRFHTRPKATRKNGFMVTRLHGSGIGIFPTLVQPNPTVSSSPACQYPFRWHISVRSGRHLGKIGLGPKKELEMGDSAPAPGSLEALGLDVIKQYDSQEQVDLKAIIKRSQDRGSVAHQHAHSRRASEQSTTRRKLWSRARSTRSRALSEQKLRKRRPYGSCAFPTRMTMQRT